MLLTCLWLTLRIVTCSLQEETNPTNDGNLGVVDEVVDMLLADLGMQTRTADQALVHTLTDDSFPNEIPADKPQQAAARSHTRAFRMRIGSHADEVTALHFERYDTDLSGYIGREELRAVVQQQEQVDGVDIPEARLDEWQEYQFTQFCRKSSSYHVLFHGFAG